MAIGLSQATFTGPSFTAGDVIVSDFKFGLAGVIEG
jgi:hypothetical protein